MVTDKRIYNTAYDIHWSKSQVLFLLAHYQLMGDAEMSELMNSYFPRLWLPWTRRHVAKKRVRMQLFRTPEQLRAIRERNNRQSRYNTKPARESFERHRQQVTPYYVVCCCLRISRPNRPAILRDHAPVIQFTGENIIRKRAERINYAVQ